MVNNRIKQLGFVFFISAAIFSCDSKKYFEEYKAIENRSWTQHQQVSFEVVIADAARSYNLFVGVRNGKRYKYQNLYLFMDIISPSGKAYRDTVECIITDVQGKWKGETAGDIVHNKVWFAKDFRFKEIGKYQFNFEQAMREESLAEIIDFGLRIE